jgi:hypothetical protein
MGDLNDLPGFTAAPTSEQRPADAVYRPMSVLAIIGFGVSCLYAAFLLICILVALFTRSAPLLASVSLLLPLAGVGLSLAGWVQVRRAEGTLAGDRLAVWGAGVGTVCALVYVAYASASYVAVRQQAEAEAQAWLGFIRKQDYARAFRLMVPPEGRPADGPNLREELEIRFNNPERGGKGAFASFRQQDYCQLLGRGGGDCKIESQGVREWDYQAGNYRVTLGYRVSTPEATGDLDVMLLAFEGRKHNSARQWAVMRDGTAMHNLQPTPLGKRVGELQLQSGSLAQGWFRHLAAGQFPVAYLDTLAPAQRERLAWEVQARQALADLVALPCLEFGGPNLTPAQSARLYLPAYPKFLKGDWLTDDPEKFWARDDKTRTEFAEAMRKALREEKPLPFRTDSLSAAGWSKADGRLQFRFDCPLMVNDDTGAPKYVGDTRLIVETDAGALDADARPVRWQVVRLELLRAGSPPALPRLAPPPQ